MSDEKSERGFVVVDKRGRDEEAPEETAQAEPRSGETAAGAEGPRELPPPDFASLVISLGTSALYHLGLMQDPQTGEPGETDLLLARQTIDTVEMLREKTRGNLDADEEKLLQSLLTDLRMRFVEVSRAKGGG